MKLLFDENLSPLLAKMLEPLYPGSVHVRDVNLSRASDEEIWNYAGAIDALLRSSRRDLESFGDDPDGAFLALG